MFEVKYGTSAVQWYKQIKRGLCTVQYDTVLVPYSLVNVHNSTVRTYVRYATHRVPRRATIDEKRSTVRVLYKAGRAEDVSIATVVRSGFDSTCSSLSLGG